LKVVDRVYSDLPANSVARQSPAPGEHMKIPQEAHVGLSLGPQNVTIPTLVGESIRVARIQLLQAGLQLGEVTSYFSPDSGSDMVLQQTPASGTRANSPRVDLLVEQSEQKPSYVMPWVVGMPLPEADRLISTGGFRLSKTTQTPSPQWPKGTVVEQTPGPGAKIDSDSPIEFAVSQ
jgi:serine/threonine-protein kinase